jgi:hypothetical protein
MVTPATNIVLGSSSGSLTLTQDEKGVGGWCRVHLLVSGVSRPLGAERLKYIATHLSSFLADAAPALRWVLSLSELHTSAYGEHVAGEAVLHLQDADAKVVPKLVLTPAERSEWLEALAKHKA